MGRTTRSVFWYGFPAVCFALGTWQLYRLQWKQSLIRTLEEGLGKRSIFIDSLPQYITLDFRHLYFEEARTNSTTLEIED